MPQLRVPSVSLCRRLRRCVTAFACARARQKERSWNVAFKGPEHQLGVFCFFSILVRCIIDVCEREGGAAGREQAEIQLFCFGNVSAEGNHDTV